MVCHSLPRSRCRNGLGTAGLCSRIGLGLSTRRVYQPIVLRQWGRRGLLRQFVLGRLVLLRRQWPPFVFFPPPLIVVSPPRLYALPLRGLAFRLPGREIRQRRSLVVLPRLGQAEEKTGALFRFGALPPSVPGLWLLLRAGKDCLLLYTLSRAVPGLDWDVLYVLLTNGLCASGGSAQRMGGEYGNHHLRIFIVKERYSPIVALLAVKLCHEGLAAGHLGLDLGAKAFELGGFLYHLVFIELAGSI